MRPLALAAAAAAFLAGCSRGAEETAEPPAPAYEEVFTGGPVSLVLRLDRREIGLADQLRFEQELIMEEGFEADFPEYLPEDFEGFAVVDVELVEPSPAGPQGGKAARAAEAASGRDRPSIAGDGAPVRTRLKRFLLEPDRSGELAIAPMEVFFRREGEEKESSFFTDEVSVSVEGIEDVASLDVRPPREIFAAPPREGGPGTGLWIAGGAGAVIFGGILLFLLLRRRTRAGPPPIPPHEIAWADLRRLLALDLVQKGEIERFYVYLSQILRRYIEGRFRVHAEEQTTEEFFEVAASASELAPHRRRLKEFLDLCDQVKFARFEPEKAVIQQSFDVLKKFIEETAAREERQA